MSCFFGSSRGPYCPLGQCCATLLNCYMRDMGQMGYFIALLMGGFVLGYAYLIPRKTGIAMDKPEPLSRQRGVILALLLALAGAAWAVLVWQHHDVSVDMTMGRATTWGLDALLFLAMWAVMMVAMMFPTAAPMILAFHSVQARTHQPDDAFVATWVFVAAYLLVWALSGIAAYAEVLAAAAVQPALVPATAAEIGGLILMVSGIYQLTPVKQRCLSECRRPIIMTSWHHSTAGALRMGLLHAVYCVGCCWLLFVILFPLGMTIEAMAAVTLVILGEKTLPRPKFVSYGAAVVLVLYGALMVVAPELPALFRIFGGLTEDEGLGLGLLVWIAALFIAAYAARPKH